MQSTAFFNFHSLSSHRTNGTIARFVLPLCALICLGGLTLLAGCSSKPDEKAVSAGGASTTSGQPAGPAPKTGNDPDQIMKEAKEGKNE